MKVKRMVTINLDNWNSKIQNITMKFYKEYVLSVNDIEQKSVNKMIACGYRYHRLNCPLREDYERLQHKFGGESDNNFKIFKNQPKDLIHECLL